MKSRTLFHELIFSIEGENICLSIKGIGRGEDASVMMNGKQALELAHIIIKTEKKLFDRKNKLISDQLFKSKK